MKTLMYKAAALCLLMLVVGAGTPLFGQASAFVGQDVGIPAHAGSVINNGNGSFTLNGGGHDIYGAADNFYYYYSSVTGLVWEAKMQILTFDGPDTWSKVGLMVRRPISVDSAPATDDPEIMNVATRTATGNPVGQADIGDQHRPTRGVNTLDHQTLGAGTTAIPPAYPNQWLRITRTNTFYTLSYGTNGTTWNTYLTFSTFNTAGTANGFDGTPWENPILVGPAITAHNDADTNGATALISNLVVTVFPIVPPTAVGVVSQIRGTTNVYAYAEANFSFYATNNANPSLVYGMNYTWYKNGTAVTTNSGTNYTFLTVPADNGASIQCVASVADPLFSSLSVTSTVLNLTLNSGALIYTNGLKQEFFAGGDRLSVENGNVPLGVVGMVSSVDVGNLGLNYGQRLSGYFIPPISSNYVFYLASDDDSDLYLSTNSSPANKRFIAQETLFSNPDQWVTSAGGSILSQKRSDQMSPDGGATTPYTAGIPLTAGQLYYIEAINHQGGGGANVGVTYRLFDDVDPVDGTPSLLTAASNNIALVTWRGTNISWVADLTPTNVTLIEGSSATFTALATSDAEMAVVYTWYINGAPYPGVTGTNFLLSNILLAYNNAQIDAVAYIPEGSLVITSRVATLHVSPAVHEAGFVKDERWDGAAYSVNSIINGSVPTVPNFQMTITEWGISTDNAGGHNNFVRRVSGYFKPPTTGLYTFYDTSDDDSILFLSTDDTTANKRQVASQGGWNSGGYRWGTANGGGVASQTISDTFTIGGVPQNPSGIMLTAGQRYYMEQDMHQGGGGANLGATFTVFGAGTPAAGTKSALNGSVIETLVPRCSFVAFTQQPVNVANAALGSSVAFSAAGTTDSSVAVGGPVGYEEAFANNKLFFQWYTNGVAVPGANSGKFLLGPVTAGMVGMPVMCQARALGYTDNALNPIWTNSTSASILSTVAAPGPSLRGHWISGAANLADTANVVGPGVYDGIAIRATNATQFYYFTNNLPPNATGQSLFLSAQGIVITNSRTADPGYVVDTFDGGLQSGATVMFWAKGWPGQWNPWVSKAGDNGTGWQLRPFSSGPNTAWTMRGTGGNDDMQSSFGSNDGQWHNYAGTWDGTSFIRNLYVDGVLAATTTGSTPYTLPSTSNLAIGARDGGGATFGNFFTGLIYDVRIYNYPLAQSQIINDGGVPLQFTSAVVAGQLVLTFPVGTLLEATNLLGPWTTNSAVSPAAIDMTGPQRFFRVKNP